MKAIKNIIVGFLVSFIGSIPLGYLNLVGLDIYTKSGINSLVFYLMGIITVEIFVIYYTLQFANQLVKNEKLIKYIEIFAIFFLLIIAYSFYAYTNNETKNEEQIASYYAYSPFIIGVVFNCFNVLQIPFWAGWNLYLLNGKYISVSKNNKYFYVFGTVVGIFLGMLAIILVLHSVSINLSFFSKYILPIFIPLFFVLLSIYQMVKVYKKYF